MGPGGAMSLIAKMIKITSTLQLHNSPQTYVLIVPVNVDTFVPPSSVDQTLLRKRENSRHFCFHQTFQLFQAVSVVKVPYLNKNVIAMRDS